MFWPSTQPRSRSPCRNASRLRASAVAETGDSRPTRAIFPGCCASTESGAARTPRASVATPIMVASTLISFSTPHPARRETSRESLLLDGPRFPVLAEDRPQRPSDLAQRRVGFHRLQDRLHEIGRPPRLVPEPGEGLLRCRRVPSATDPRQLGDLGGGPLGG